MGDSPLEGQSQRLVMQKLTNQQATRVNIIDGFQTNLSQATAEDVVLFVYSCHGSKEKAHADFSHLEPNGLNETLVCYDSRLPGQWALADKELNALIAKVGQRCPHIIAIFDCCHSGSGLRDIATVPCTTTDERDRPLTAALNGYSETTAKQVVSHLEHITRWFDVLELAPPDTSPIALDEIQMQLFDGAGEEIQTPASNIGRMLRENGKKRPFG